MASFLSFAGIAAFAAACRLSAQPGAQLPSLQRHSPPDPPQRYDSTDHPSVLGLPLSMLTVVSVVVSATIALQLGSVGGALTGDFGRQNVRSGYAYLLVNLAGVGVLVAVASLPIYALRRWSTRFILAGGYSAFLAVHLLVLGGRAEIIIISVALLTLTTHRLGRPRKWTLAAVLIVSTAALGVVRVATREAFVSGGRDEAPVALVASALRDPVALITKYDVSAYDKLVILEQAGGRLGNGETYVAALLSALPSTPPAGLEGGNRAFTRRFFPARYARGVTYEGISMFGEARYNLGWIGPPLAGALAGWGYGTLIRTSRRGGMSLLVLSLSAGVFPNLVRADALNTAALGGSLILFTLLMNGLITKRKQRSTPSLPARPRAPTRSPSGHIYGM